MKYVDLFDQILKWEDDFGQTLMRSMSLMGRADLAFKHG
jgi:hypothetical protein